MLVISAVPLLLLAQPSGLNPSRFNVAWRPESDPPFAKIRKEVEPYALRKTTSHLWVRKQAVAANAAWKRTPNSAESWYRAMLWEKVLVTAHYNEVTSEDTERRGGVELGLRNLRQIPTSREFSRLVVSSYRDSSMLALTIKHLERNPGDGLLASWSFPTFQYSNPTKSTVKMIQSEVSAFYRTAPHLWVARLTWATSPWIVTKETTLKDVLEMLRESDRRFKKLRATHSFGKREQVAMDEWAKNLPKFIKGYEDLVRKGRGSELQINYRG